MSKSEIQLGENVMGCVEGDKLTITIDLKQRLHSSASGKSIVVATTGGNKLVAQNVYIGVNAYTKR
jgi:hypothetical protein